MITNDVYCSMIHGGLTLDFKADHARAQNCCLRSDFFAVDTTKNFWNDPGFVPLRQLNQQHQWSPGCSNCKKLEHSGLDSFRIGANQGLNVYAQTDLSGPARIDLMFDISCNLACRICGTQSSTLWQKHLKQHGEWTQAITVPTDKQRVIQALSQLDLSNLRMLVFCGGETLLGRAYWDIAEWLAEHVPEAKKQLTLCFQTNGTQTIQARDYEIIEKFHLVKLHVSLDGIQDKFEYQRWPADWNQVVDNLSNLRQNLPSNVMFLVEETVSIFNLFYLDELENWTQQNFSSNREGDIINHTRHMARGKFDTVYCTREYVEAMQDSPYRHLIAADWQEQPEKIRTIMADVQLFDSRRGQDFQKTFPEIAEFYRRYL
jgi:sulfatase maturation enzyme AslB (radical SAM superfamily)